MNKEMLTGNGDPDSIGLMKTKKEWIDFGALLFWSGIVFR
jgi:hypothetical protein